MQTGHIEFQETHREWEDQVSDLQPLSSNRVSFTLIKVLHLNCDSGGKDKNRPHTLPRIRYCIKSLVNVYIL